MTAPSKDPPPDGPPPEAGKLPTGRLARTARVGGLVTGQGLRWAGMRTANRVRTPERAAAAQSERTAALVNQLVDQLGQMRGAAMKVGQMISMVEFEGLPEEERDELQAKLAALRDDVPPVPFAELLARSSFSFLEGASQPREIVAAAKALGLSAVALCDRDGLYGSVRAHAEAKEIDQKLIVGAELTLVTGATVAELGPLGAATATPMVNTV